MSQFAEYLGQLAKAFGSQKALADALKITPQRLSRAITEGDYTLNVENCLRLAHVAGRSPAEVLRAAGKGDVAELLEALYPRSSKAVPPKEHQLLTRFRALDAEARDVILEIVRLVQAGEPAAVAKRGRA